MNWTDLQGEVSYSSFKAYQQAKLANILFSRELAVRYGHNGVTTASNHPGIVRSEIWEKAIGKNFSFTKVIFYFFLPLFYLITKDCRDGAQTIIHCALDDEIQEKNGQYFV
jgi:NAD(P)-dependent dehydrogenase (short-subunit alcohol dehydrogenase family)